jgi:hypothetical protein
MVSSATALPPKPTQIATPANSLPVARQIIARNRRVEHGLDGPEGG